MSVQISESDRCLALDAVTDEDLISFYDDLDNKKSKAFNSCEDRLRKRLTNYLSLKSGALSANYKRIAEKKLSPCSNRKSATFGPEENYLVDPTNSGILFGDMLPKCGITFTFDDGPHATLTPQLLNILRGQDVLVNFFVVGRQVRAHPEILRNQYSDGHLIGNHSMTHADLRRLSFKEATAEIENGFDIITKVVGEHLPFFRFPYFQDNSL